MLRECDIRRRGKEVLVGVALENAVLDFETTDAELRDALAFLNSRHTGIADLNIGRFGKFHVRLNAHSDNSFSIFIDGPAFDPPRELSAAIWLSKQDLIYVLTRALSGA